jgi:hypothetical protein
MFALSASVASNSLSAAGIQGERLPVLAEASSADVAAQVDGLIHQSLAEQGIAAAEGAADEDFLRRVSLDLAGTIPTPEEVAGFSDSTDEGKRTAVVDRLLEAEGFSQTWASYWREVIFSRATDMRSRRAQGVFETWMAEQLAANRPWDEIVTALLTATGDTSEEGSTGLIFAHGGDPAELAAETSRIFLGIQIQCANCHDHPYDAWKRKDFHELAAFFPRIRLRRDGEAKNRTFFVESADNLRDTNAQPFDFNQAFRFLDRNRDGELTEHEAQRSKPFGKRFAQLTKRGDKDSDGALSLAELKEVTQRPQNQLGRGSSEYYMPDLEDPAARGTRTQPVFFIDEKSVPFGTQDVDRRTFLAEALVAPENPWFARAFVNRIWAEMLGDGFYMPIDDMGPQRSAELTAVLDLLAAGFIANHYDIKWLYRTIALTDAYQGAFRSSEPDQAAPAVAAMSPTRLRGDQIFNAVRQILGADRFRGGGMPVARRMGGMGPGRGDAGRAAFALLFNYDPSTPQADLTGTIPQALFMMNAPATNAAINGRRGTVLARILRESDDDDAALEEIYLRVLSREPSDAEIEICRQHLADVGNRAEAFEDIMWSLMNSSEFLTKR